MPLANPQRFRECREATAKMLENWMTGNNDEALKQSLMNQALILDMMADITDISIMIVRAVSNTGLQPPENIKIVRPGMHP